MAAGVMPQPGFPVTSFALSLMPVWPQSELVQAAEQLKINFKNTL